MKKRKLHLSKLSLNKAVIGSLAQEKIVGGATMPWETCGQTCLGTCFCTEINCVSRDPNGVTCVLECNTMICSRACQHG